MPDRRFDWFLIVLAIAVRAAAVLVLQSHTVPHSTYEHGEIAANLLAGRGFSVRFLGAEGPTSQQAPVYPALVAAAYAVGGVGTPRALLILELGQAALGGLLVAAVLRLAREVAPERPRVAWLAGLIVALHPTLVYAATHVQVALLAATLLTATLAWAYRAGRTGRDRDAIGDGPPARGAGPDRPDPGAGRRRGRLGGRAGPGRLAGASGRSRSWRWRRRRGWPPGSRGTAWVHGEFVGIKSTFGYAFWQGNCALSEGTDKVVRASVERALDAGEGRAGSAGSIGRSGTPGTRRATSTTSP